VRAAGAAAQLNSVGRQRAPEERIAMRALSNEKYTRQRLQYPLEVAHKARHALCVGAEDVRYRALAATLEIANLPEDQLPVDLREERRAILDLANRYEGPRSLRKCTGQKVAQKIYDLCRAIETRYLEA
jgi:hypothetical protein